MAAALEEPPDDLAAGVVGVGDQQDGFWQVEACQQEQEFIKEGSPVAVAKNQAFVDAGAQGKGMVKASDAGQESQGLAGMAHDESGLRIGLAGLMEEFDRGPLAAAFTLFQAVGQDDNPAVAALDAGMDPEGKPAPEPGEAIGTEGLTVEEIQ
jgi:hypothetical protein